MNVICMNPCDHVAAHGVKSDSIDCDINIRNLTYECYNGSWTVPNGDNKYDDPSSIEEIYCFKGIDTCNNFSIFYFTNCIYTIFFSKSEHEKIV